ncbi:hypothetical protein PN419_00085 [Halorubrum ezzemoulense]|uniref:hypothetical protein n=1 Tax=Halorubrum ezzemoulense TaxID=337243 RepID=UPI00232B6679|nr:hypothetical protein [Halorubrum ezzemoulense]MDB9247405.1 hypothetical protein [Halorubrum ezzemoulense]MDB9258686.1 hypothetical protein [Halorubrum ezzemoulense]MDB9264456.1 hypothetical protein [Halorubrum ezzemoulense]MDB9269047.1 hypothetical protein [Halorubrum ezzemoulense]MDB9271424.1 hypothetical protein [Halorubrum ezzemoulense]
MIVTPLSLFAVALMVRWADGGVEDDVQVDPIAPAVVDLFAWYIVGSYLGVF